MLTMILAISCTLIGVNAQSEEKIEMFSYSINTTGPVWLEYNCQQTACQGMELIVNNSGLIHKNSDPHTVEWEGMVEGNISWQLLVEEGISEELIEFDSIISNEVWSEKRDLPDIVPSPSEQEDFEEIETFSQCQMNRCQSNDFEAEGVFFTGALESLNDKDAIRIVGNKGDVLLLPNFRSSSEMEIEIWMRNDEIKERIESLNSGHDTEYFFEYPEGELWLRVIASVETEYSTYEFKIVRYDANRESLDLRELTNPWTHGDALAFNDTYHGHISASDTEGDSILIELGSKMEIKPICHFSNDFMMDIIIHEINSIEKKYLENISSCPEIINSTYLTNSIEFRIKSNITQPWSIKINTDSYGDGKSIVDAPDFIWQPGTRDGRWELVDSEMGEYSGNLGIQDYIDIFAFEITHENGSKVYFNDTGGEVSFKILVLNQTSGAIINSTDQSEIIVPQGIHAIRIEKNNSSSDIVNYRFKAPEIREYQIENRELEDFAYVSSHDLQEPLRKIRAFGDRLKTKEKENLSEKGQDYIDRMLSSAERMQQLISDLLRFSRITSKAKPFEQINLNKVLSDVISDLEIAINESEAEIHIDHLPNLKGDSTQLRQLFQNLISNAIKFKKDDTQSK